MKFKKTALWIGFVALSLVLTLVFFAGLDSNEFIYSGDQFFRFSKHEAFANSFFLRKSVDLGVLNGWQFATQFWDAIYYLFAFRFTSDLKLIEEVLFFMVLLLSLGISYWGVSKFFREENCCEDTIVVFLISVWYAFNPYTLELWHGGVYNLGSSLTYSLAPIVFYYFKSSVFSKTNLKNIFMCALLLGVSSFTFWLFAPLLFFLSLYWLLQIFRTKLPIKIVAINSALLIVSYLPLVAFVLTGIMHEFFNRGGDNNATFDPTFGNIQGGLGYQLLMLFSWAIYTDWTPRTMYPFASYFFSPAYFLGIGLLYFVILAGVISVYRGGLKDRKWALEYIFTARLSRVNLSEMWIILGIFAVSVFFAKGGQAPAGEIFIYLYNHVPFFSVFRTPDIRFGFIMVLCLAILLAVLAKQFKTYVLRFSLFIFTLLQAWPFFSGIAVRGENVPGKYFDRVVHIPADYSELAQFINANGDSLSYVLPIPAVEYGHYRIDQGENLVGQDMLSKLIEMPFLYTSSSGGVSTNTYQSVKDILDRQEYGRLLKFPIEYVVIRTDIDCSGCDYSEDKLAQISSLVFQNATFRLYLLNNYSTIIKGQNVKAYKVSPVQYAIQLKGVRADSEINFLQSYNENWRLFLVPRGDLGCDSSGGCAHGRSIFKVSDFNLFSASQLGADSHKSKIGYENTWVLSKDEVELVAKNGEVVKNVDGSIDFSAVLIYYPQLSYILAGLASLFAFLVLLMAIIFVPTKEEARHG